MWSPTLRGLLILTY